MIAETTPLASCATYMHFIALTWALTHFPQNVLVETACTHVGQT